MDMAEKFAFIICVNNEIYFRECQYYIQKLEIPKGYDVEIVEVRNASSMCAGYNEGMNSTNAKYKIYMHQDVCIIKKDFLQQLLNRFESNTKLGIIGMVGGSRLPDTGVIFDCWNEGKVDVREPDMAYYLELHPREKKDVDVLAVDGLLMATQYDIQWREDLFSHFDFYDVSQCLEFKKKGYDILVPYQKTPWTVHDCSFCKLSKYNDDRETFLEQYYDFLQKEEEDTFYYNKEWEELSEQLAGIICQMIDERKWEQAEEALKLYHQKNHKSSILERIHIILEIHSLELKKNAEHFFHENTDGFWMLYDKYIVTRNILRRVELGFWDEECQELEEKIGGKLISLEAIIMLVIHGSIHKERMIHWLRQICSSQHGSLELDALKPYEELIQKTENSQKTVGGKYAISVHHNEK